MKRMTAEEIRQSLDLEANATCGFVRVSFVADREIAAGGMAPPFADRRPAGSALYFLVTPQAPVKLHRIQNDQLYHYYLGDPLEVLLLRGKGERVIVGPDIEAGHRLQLLIPGGTFHTARVLGARPWFLGASTEWPGVIPADVKLGDVARLAAQYPHFSAEIASFQVPVAS
jgi:uncharacterized protein